MIDRQLLNKAIKAKCEELVIGKMRRPAAFLNDSYTLDKDSHKLLIKIDELKISYKNFAC